MHTVSKVPFHVKEDIALCFKEKPHHQPCVFQQVKFDGIVYMLYDDHFPPGDSLREWWGDFLIAAGTVKLKPKP